MSWIDDTLARARRRHVSRLIDAIAQDAFRRGWHELSEVERHAIMEHIAERELFGSDVDLEQLTFRCRLCGTHTVRYVEWAPLQCEACRITYTWIELDPTELVIE